MWAFECGNNEIKNSSINSWETSGILSLAPCSSSVRSRVGLVMSQQRGRGAWGTCKALSVIITWCGPPSDVLCTCEAPWGSVLPVWGMGRSPTGSCSCLNYRLCLARCSVSQREQIPGCNFSSSVHQSDQCQGFRVKVLFKIKYLQWDHCFPRMHCNRIIKGHTETSDCRKLFCLIFL